MASRGGSVFGGAVRRAVWTALLAVAACGGGTDPGTTRDLEDPGAGGPAAQASCTPVQARQLLVEKCSSCHAQSTAASIGGGLDLASEGVEARLWDRASSDGSCKDRKLVSATDSFLLEKLENARPQCGSQMPMGYQLEDRDLKCLEDYVAGLRASGGR